MRFNRSLTSPRLLYLVKLKHTYSQILDEFMDILNRDRSPVCGQHGVSAGANNPATATTTTTNSRDSNGSHTNTTPNTNQRNSNNQPHILESSVQRNLTNFSLITHGFGTPAIMAALNVVRAYLNESMKIIDRQHPAIGNASAHTISLHQLQQQHHHQQQHHQQQQLLPHHLHQHHQQLQHNHLGHQQQHSNGSLADSGGNNNTASSLHNHHHNQTYHHSALIEPKKEII